MDASNPERTLIDNVIQLALLASDRQVIDPLMEDVRRITARWRPDQPLSEADRSALSHVKAELTNHLLHNDPLRHFTQQELDAQLQGGQKHGHQSLRQVLGIMLLASLAYPVGVGFFYWLKLPHASLLGVTFFTSVLYAGMVRLYWSALGTFTPQLRLAYKWICVNMALFGVAAIASSIFNAFPQYNKIPLISYTGIAVFMGWLAFLVGYIGVRQFALSLALRSWLTSWPVVLAATAAAVGLVFIVPHVAVPTSQITFVVALLPCVVTALYATLVAVLGLRIGLRVTSLYARAIGWYAVAYAQAAIISVVAIAMICASGPLYGTFKIIIIEAVFATCGFSLIIAGYMFSRSVGKS